MSVNESARYAELICTPEFGDAVQAAVESDPVNYQEQRKLAEICIIGAMYDTSSPETSDWEARRQLAMIEMSGKPEDNAGHFSTFIHDRGGRSNPSVKKAYELGPGEPGPVSTNEGINRLKSVHNGDPIDFLDSCIDLINHKGALQNKSVGPENYATALKYFTDMYAEFPSQHLDKAQIARSVERAVFGFNRIARTDTPNFVEMGNMLTSLRILPRGTFPAEGAKEFIKHNLEQLPTYDAGMANTFYGGLSKLPADLVGGELATLIDLGIRHFGSFQKTHEMQLALRAVQNLPSCPESNRAFATFLAFRNNLETAVDLETAEEMSGLLLAIVEENIADDLGLIVRAKDMADTLARRAIGLYDLERRNHPDMLPSQAERMRAIVNQTIKNMTLI